MAIIRAGWGLPASLVALPIVRVHGTNGNANLSRV